MNCSRKIANSFWGSCGLAGWLNCVVEEALVVVPVAEQKKSDYVGRARGV
jgi:hypothetical protein